MLRKVNFVIAALCLVFLSATMANAQDQDPPECYTPASLQGFVRNYRSLWRPFGNRVD